MSEDSEFVLLYSQLIDMGYDENMALNAAQQCNNINEAIEWMENCQAAPLIYHNNCIDGNEQDMKYPDVICNGQETDNCLSFKRIILMLKFYQNNHVNYDTMSEYVEKYKLNLITDYHHILDCHLNEDNILKTKCDNQFAKMFRMIEDNDLLCDIEKCKIYSRNNRQRETVNIACNDNKLSMFIDIMDTIHCYFIHSVDIGFRIFDIDNHNNNNDDESYHSFKKIQSDAFDPQMINLRDYLNTKWKTIESIRGIQRCSFNKFITLDSDIYQSKVNHIDSKSMTNYDEEEVKLNEDQDANDVLQEGFLKKKSLHLQRFRKRFIILRNKHLYCYTNDQQIEMTECIDLSSYKETIISQKGIGRFDLIPINKKNNKIRTFQADSMDIAEEWVNTINGIIKPIIIPNKSDQKQKSESVFSFGEYHNYWSKKSGLFSRNECGKYKSIKEEVTSNKIYSISMDHFNDAFNKSEHLINNSSYIKYLRCDRNNQYGMKQGDTIKNKHILSVVLYTDYDKLSYKFSSTFRKILNNESDEFMQKRNAEFWHWSKTLIETVNGFGQNMSNSKISVFYHGVSFIYFTSFIATFNSPTSTTTKLAIAYQFATNNGIILEIGKRLDIDRHEQYVKYFNCSFVSCFGNEDERLFLQPERTGCNLNIVSIRNMSTCESYRKYIFGIRIFQEIIQTDYDPVDLEKSSIESKKIINQIIAVLWGRNINSFPFYVSHLLKYWMKDIKKIAIYFPFLKDYYSEIVIYNKSMNMIHINILNEMFINVEEMELVKVPISCAQLFCSLMIAYLKRINSLSFSRLRKIYIFAEKDHVVDDSINLNFYEKSCAKIGWELTKGESILFFHKL